MSEQIKNISEQSDVNASISVADNDTIPGTAKLNPQWEADAPAAESFFLNNFNVDRLFRGIERGDYIFLYYIQMYKEGHPEQEPVYLSELAEAMNLNVTEISKAMEHLQDKGYIIWKTDASLGKTYVLFTTKTVELMADGKERIIKCYEAVVQEIGMGELAETVMTMKKIRDIINQTNTEME
ncbi:MAG: MarR family winged helix-turn-helix transcriptional regulator [Lachnospiraceae bacterium]|nr:MarR family winged helix-turn-helix transcriptional regulator [Lachnospiraceae bacterium]